MAGTMRVLPVSGLHARPFWVVELIVKGSRNHRLIKTKRKDFHQRAAHSSLRRAS